MKILPVKPYFPKSDIEIIKQNIEEVLLSGMLSSTRGKYVNEFERRFRNYVGTHYAIATNSGTSALQYSFESFKLKSGFEVIAPTNTFSATISSIIHAGGKPVLCDINPKTLCLDIEQTLSKITYKTKSIVIVHLGGIISPEIEELKTVCSEENIFLVEDCAHAHGSTFMNQKAGSFGDIGCFSFYPTKVMTTGEGGMLVANNLNLYITANKLRDQGREKYESEIISELGSNGRMSEIEAVIGLVQLNRLDEIVKKRRLIAKFYDYEIARIDGIKSLKIPENCKSSYYKYITLLDEEINRDKVKMKLKKEGVICGSEVYNPPIHLQPIYKQLLKTKRGDFIIAEEMARRMLCLPIYPSLNINQLKYVTKKLKEALQ